MAFLLIELNVIKSRSLSQTRRYFVECFTAPPTMIMAHTRTGGSGLAIVG
jgi:hypothetical protein